MSESNYFPSFVFSEWQWGDKDKLVNHIAQNILTMTLQMFKYDGLPDTIPQRVLETYIQVNGFCGIIRIDSNLYAVGGGLGGKPDYNYMPTLLIVSNPALSLGKKQFDIDKNCVIIQNDKLYHGMRDRIRLASSRLADNIITMRLVDINSRIPVILAGANPTAKQSLEVYIKNIIAGKIGVALDNEFIESLKTVPYGSTSAEHIKPLIEESQYIYGSFLNEVGINANFNMKREALNSAESGLNDNVLRPLIDDMLECRQDGVEKINAMFGTNISVSLDSCWDIQKDADVENPVETVDKSLDQEEPEEEEKEDVEN